MDFIGKKWIWFTFSGTLIFIAILALIGNGVFHGKAMNFGIDFTGGTLLSLRFDKPVTIDGVRDVLVKYNLAESSIQKVGEADISIKSAPMETDVRTKIIDDLKEKLGNATLLEADTIGPVIGKELRTEAILALIVASIGITIYVSFRFEFIYAVAALFALYHDAIITTGIIALMWRNVDTTFVAAILTIMGYSINDTIVIFDRIRENVGKEGTKKPFIAIVNESITQTMARSINTILTVIVMIVALLAFGGETIKEFNIVLLIGFVFGGYSSIFIASPIVVMFKKAEGKQRK
ncbi:MAG: protein translocase subunit SecF [Candidatus Saganbacteria bacterium]|nr:protein translocase subunit SecF [Candidatus Saganbacteria bacterium]